MENSLTSASSLGKIVLKINSLFVMIKENISSKTIKSDLEETAVTGSAKKKNLSENSANVLLKSICSGSEREREREKASKE